MSLSITTTDDELIDSGTEAGEIADGLGLSLREAFDLIGAGTSTGPVTFAAPGTTFTLNNGSLFVGASFVMDGNVSVINTAGTPILTFDVDNVTFENTGSLLSADGTASGNAFNRAVTVNGDDVSFINGGDIYSDSDTSGGFGDRGAGIVVLGDDFTFTNQTGATVITEGRSAVEAAFTNSGFNSLNLTIINDGLLEGADDTIRIASGVVTNSGTIRTTGTFNFGGNSSFAPGEIADALSIVGQYDVGFVPDPAGLVVVNNLVGGAIEGARGGLFMSGGGTVNNAGSITADVVGIFGQSLGPAFDSHFMVNNAATGVISRGGDSYGLNSPDLIATIMVGNNMTSAAITNEGQILSPDVAIYSYMGLVLNNEIGGLIEGDTDSIGNDAVAFQGTVQDDFIPEPSLAFVFLQGGESIFSTQGYSISPTGDLTTPSGDFPFSGGQAEVAYLGSGDPILALVDLAATVIAGVVVYQLDGVGATLFPDTFTYNYNGTDMVNITGFNTAGYTITDSNGDQFYDIPAGVNFVDIITNDGTMIGDVNTGYGDDIVTNNGSIDGDVHLGTLNDTYTATGTGSVTGTVFGGAGMDTLSGGAGDDIFEGGTGLDIIDGGAGFDTASFASSSAGVTVFNNGITAGLGGDAAGEVYTSIEAFIGSAHNDQLVFNGTTADNVAFGGGGDDRIRSRDGGNEEFHGEGGDDRLFGGTGNDQLFGGDGEDDLFGGAGNDFLDGGSGDNARDVLIAGAGNDFLYGYGGNDALRGNTGNDMLFGGDGDDGMEGGSGVDELYGQNGNDTLEGEGGQDILDGGFGNDRMTGGSSADTFIFDLGYGTDRIVDFNFGAGDVVDLTGFGLANYAAVVALMTQTGTDARINFGTGETLIFLDFDIGDFSAADFILGGGGPSAGSAKAAQDGFIKSMASLPAAGFDGGFDIYAQDFADIMDMDVFL